MRNRIAKPLEEVPNRIARNGDFPAGDKGKGSQVHAQGDEDVASSPAIALNRRRLNQQRENNQ